MTKKNTVLSSLMLCLLVGVWGCDNYQPEPPPDDVPRDEAPTWSPDGRWIAYWHFNPDLADTLYPTGLYVVDANGQERRLVVAGYANNPDWSPDGERLAFDSGDLFTIKPDGSELFQITEYNNGFFPSWSPQSDKLVFDTAYQDARGANAIWIISSDGTNSKDISQHGLGEWRDPSWSFSGQKILHLRFLTGVFGEEIFVMDTTGATAQRLTQNEHNDRYPTWSPDDSEIAWTILDEGNNEIWLMMADGSNQRKLTEGAMPAWSPDGQQLAYSHPTPSRDRVVLWVINRDGSGRRQLTH
jgi:TolB protein